MRAEEALAKIQQELAVAPAAEVADAFLSPHILEEFFLGALDEEGPSLWIVNRSDVWNETLQMLSHHRIKGIAGRAEEKIKQRQSKLLTIAPPEVPINYTDITDDSVEDFLGHPLAPFEAILFFSRSISEDHRGSAALSFSRRILEYPPNWFEEKISKNQILEKMMGLLEDPSSYVRAYAARNPLIDEATLRERLIAEKNPTVKTRLIQHPATSARAIEEILLSKNEIDRDQTLQFTAALDKRSTVHTRREALKNQTLPEITRCVHEWYLVKGV